MFLAFDIFPAATPNGTRLVRLDSTKLLRGSFFRVELFRMGSGRIVLNQYQAEATTANLAKDNYVKVFDLDISTTLPLGGFFLANGDFRLLDVNGKGAQDLAFGGPGALSYFGRAVLANTTYLGGSDGPPHADGQFHWYGPTPSAATEQYGDILRRLIREAQDVDRPQQPLAAMTYDFTALLDSAGAAWEGFTGEYTLPIGTNYLTALQKFVDLGITPQMTGNLLLKAYQGFYGTDRTSTIFAANKIRFVNVDGAAGANIVENLSRRYEPGLELSQVLVKGDATTPASMVIRTAGSYNVVREGFLDTQGSHAIEVLQDAGDKAIKLRSDAADAPSFKHIPGNDALNGLYQPFPGASGETLSEFFDAQDGGTSLSWVGILPNQSGGAEGSAYYYFKSTSPDNACVARSASPGGHHFTGYVAMAAGEALKVVWRNDAAGSTGAITETGSMVLQVDVLHSGAASAWTAFDVTVTAPAGTTSYSFLRVGGISFDRIRHFLVSTPPTSAYWVGDLVTLHTGTLVGDYNNAALRVYAINWEMAENGDWWPRPELGGVIRDRGVGSVVSLGGSGGGVVSAAPATPLPTVKQELTNKSGATVDLGDVVAIDTANDEAFVTTTLAGETRQLGVVMGTIGNNAKGYVALHGYVEYVNVTASVTRGHFGYTSTTAKKASGATPRAAGAFCQFLKGGTTPSAILFGPPDHAEAWKQPVRAATTAAGTLATSFANASTIDGVVLATGDRILIKDQAAGAENGIYTVNATGAPTRASDLDASPDILGAAVFVTEGTANGDKAFFCTTNAPITLGTTALVFAALSGGGALVVQEEDTTVEAAATTLDFGVGFNITSSPAGEANIALDRGPASTQVAAGDHTHADGDSSKASATADYTPTTATATDVTGATLSLASGTYIVVGNFDVTRNGATNDRTFEGVLDVNAVDENDLAVWTPLGTVAVRSQVVQVWRVVLASTLTVKLQARHSGGTAGDFTVNAANTTLAAYRAGGAVSADTLVIKTADEVVNNSITLQDDNHLLFAIAANEVWAWEAEVYYDAADAANAKFAYTVPTGATLRWADTGSDAGDTAVAGQFVQTVSGSSRSASATGVGNIRHTRQTGFCVNSTTAGNVTLQWAQNTAAASDMTVRQYSTIRARKLA